jgi:hypothetical protein
MFSILTNLTKAAVAVVVSPVALVVDVVDVVRLPATAYYDRNPFENTSKVLSSAGKSVMKAIE